MYGLLSASELRTFTARAALLDSLEFAPPEEASLTEALLEKNARFVRRLRQRLLDGRYTRLGLRQALWRQRGRAATGYDGLDVLTAQLFDAGPPSTERIALSDDMVRYQPTPARVVLDLVEQAALGSSDVFYDLGAGFGHVALLVALLSEARVIGIEIEPAYCERADASAALLGLRNVQFICADARCAGFGDATVFFLYTPFRGRLLRDVLARLRLLTAHRALRIFSYGPCSADLAQTEWLEPQGASIHPDTLSEFYAPFCPLR